MSWSITWETARLSQPGLVERKSAPSVVASMAAGGPVQPTPAGPARTKSQRGQDARPARRMRQGVEPGTGQIATCRPISTTASAGSGNNR